jgi:hypothetical protein
MARTVASKSGGWWLGTFVWGAILIAFLFGANRVGKKYGTTKAQNMCVHGGCGWHTHVPGPRA